jgi:hypothetical protein
MSCVAELVGFALHRLKERGLLNIDLLEALASKVQGLAEKSIFSPIFHAVRDVLLNQELLPADDGTFIYARNVKLAGNADLRELISNDQLRELHQADSDLKWLSGEITVSRTPNLRNYLMKVLGVAEIDPDAFTRKLTDSFIEDQSDEWMIALYRFVAPIKALWKPGSGYLNPSGPLRSKQFIRLQDGSHVSPFRNESLPNAYLALGTDVETSLQIVKTELSSHKDVYNFLKELGIPELDIVEEVIERILLKYASFVPIAENHRDIEKILRAYATDSQEKKRRLKEKLQSTDFILTLIPGSQILTDYRKPEKAYFPNDKLMVYFCGNNTVGFVSSDYGEAALEMFKELGVKNEIRIWCKSKPGSVENIPLDYNRGYRRGLKGFDPEIEVEGIEYAIANMSIEKSVIIWNEIAIQYNHCIKGKILRSSRQDFSPNASTHKEEETISKFGQLLKDNFWLPDRKGNFHKPSDLNLNDLPEEFIPNEKLADQLGMRKDIFAKLAEEAGIPAEDIDLLRKYPEEFNQWKAMVSAKKEDYIFPSRPSADPERREQKIIEKYKKAPKKKYEKVTQSTKTTENTIDPKTWLNETYKNDAGELICQICKKEMPFKKRDRHYYFEAVEIISDFDREMEELHIALCPLCAAMYNEFVKLDESAMKELKYALKSSNEPEVSLNLGNLKTSIRFVDAHYQDIKTILGTQE